MLDVRVCSSCLSRRSNGLSRVSEKIWNSCLSYLYEKYPTAIVVEDGFIEVFADTEARQLLMTSEDGFNIEDTLLKETIQAGFVSYRIEF